MSVGDQFLYDLPPRVLWEFCRVMDALSDLDWTRFASMVLDDQTALRLAQKQEKRTDWVMNQWEIRNGRVGELVNLLEGLELLRPRDVILKGVSRLKPPPPPAPAAPPTAPAAPRVPSPPFKSLGGLSTAAASGVSTQPPNGTVCLVHKVEGKELPRPAPPPSRLLSEVQEPSPLGRPHTQPSVAEVSCSSGLMCWSYEEVHAGTKGFSPTLQVGEGGFGVVYKATLSNTVCAVKVLKEDRLLDWKVLNQSFQTEMEKLSKFRHPNIVDLLGFSKGPGTVCLIYSYMENKSLEHKLHNQSSYLSWSQRVSVVTEASTALQFLHSPPSGNTPLIHGDVKSSNILLDHHMTAKLGDFGLARFAPRPSPSETKPLGRTTTIRGTLAYLPHEYVRTGKLGTVVDVYSFGVVLLEVLTGRRALEEDQDLGQKYLKDLVEEIRESPSGSPEESWRKQLDHRLLAEGATEPAGWMEMVALACRCLANNRKGRPAMAEVFDKLQDINTLVKRSSPHMDLSGACLSKELSKLGPLEDTYQPAQSSQSSSCSSSCSLQSPHRLRSPSSHVSSSSSCSPSPSSFAGPCETDESRGFSQYDLQSKLRTNGTAFRCVSPSTKDRHQSPTASLDAKSHQASVPTEEHYSLPLQPSGTSHVSSTGRCVEPDHRGHHPAGLCGVLKPLSPVRTPVSVLMNPSKQHLLQKKTLYEEGRIETPELLSSEDIYGGTSSVALTGPEESDEQDWLPAQRQ
ncbi:interleukin-1 receptor-associated kinase 1 isoform X1 [Takifugu rubripes]|uniref:interleukin-1 receptor-associated kinase 1 isoform X1 n=1 Tax=Takifugu rubripes TaxID=31033 RepID=UPI0005D1C079|nr:interleukin-1 receptor-associated kinase 1 isoform X1 [Takifugu rubripes]|eukprot:XP_011619245.1 PREDICTED: interleukin-1 receptor-associated kinase 1-like isoform X1 [Takifugu rubripes]